MKVCVITCYKQPDYIRGKVFRQALAKMDDVSLSVVKNKHTGLWRYIEVLAKVILIRFRENPDVYILTFRGYEMLAPIRILTLGKKLVFDELINMVEWVVYEHKKVKIGSLADNLLRHIYGFWLKTVDVILADTPSHAEVSSRLSGVAKDKYQSIIVSTDEDIFSSSKTKTTSSASKFTVFYYGNMLPLHGIDIVAETAVLLKDNADIKFQLVGGKASTQRIIDDAKQRGANIDYIKWLEFEKLPAHMKAATVCLAGPFGDTYQSQFVITGKAYQLLQLGCPIIIGRNKETHIFTDKENAIVCRQGSSESLGEAILWAYNNRSQLHSIGEKGQALYKDKLSNKILSQQLEQLLLRFRSKNE